MSLPPPPVKLSKQLPNGKTVCYAHSLGVCPICCVDFQFMDEDEEGEDEDSASSDLPEEYHGTDDEDEYVPEEDEGDDRVFVLGAGVNRFMPQWNAQILGPANTLKFKQNRDNPPKPLPLSSISLHQCTTCELTWLIGEVGAAAAKSHPSHHTYLHEYAGTRRSLLVFVDGACASNGAADAKAGIGVYFGSASKYNLSEAFTLQGVATNQRAELHAVARAMETVRRHVMLQRKQNINNTAAGRDAEGIRDLVHLTLIIVTDSSYVVEGMCSYFKNWTYNESRQSLVNKKGKKVKNSAGFMRIEEEVEALSMIGVQVEYYYVDREENADADRLAKVATTKDAPTKAPLTPMTAYIGAIQVVDDEAAD